MYYANHMSLLLDIRVIFTTFVVLFKRVMVATTLIRRLMALVSATPALVKLDPGGYSFLCPCVVGEIRPRHQDQ